MRLAKTTTNLFRVRSATTTPGLDVSGLTGVIEVDPATRTAEVQGMCTYEDLVDATLAHGLIPLVVPQLRTITLGGAVTGLGIESTSFRNGLPHESVLEMDVFTGAGEVVTTRPGESLFDAFPNSYGSLGYATRLRISLEAVPAYVALRHVRFDDAALMAKAIAEITASGEYDGERVDGLDGVAFEPGEHYLTLARWTDGTDLAGATGEIPERSDYAGQDVFFRSVQERETDLLTMYDYLWRWDTDWFWCSGAFGAQNPRLRRLWPRRLRRSDVYMRLLALDRRFDIADRLDRRAGRPLRERVVQDIEVPVDRLAEFLEWFDREIGMRPGVGLPPRVHGLDRAGGAGRRTPSRRGSSTSTSASGAPSTSGRMPPTRHATGRSRRRSMRWAGINRSTPRLSTTRRPSTGSTAATLSPSSRIATTPINDSPACTTRPSERSEVGPCPPPPSPS